jgi:hypothetical protein
MVGNCSGKFPSESSKSCSISLVEFVEKEVPVNGKSLNLRRINFEQLLFTIQRNQAATQLSTSQSTVHKVLRNSLGTLSQVPVFTTYNSPDKEVHYTLCRDILSKLEKRFITNCVYEATSIYSGILRDIPLKYGGNKKFACRDCTCKGQPQV